jgi:DNA-binding GntR family transcriptional regulator
MQKNNSTAQKDKAAKKRPARGSGVEAVHKMLRHEILTLALKPGDNLDEKLLARRFGVSRTPLREAFLRLSGEKLVNITPNRGAKVTGISVTSFPQYIESLSYVQRAIHYLAAQRRTDADIDRIERACIRFEMVSDADNVDEMVEANTDFHSAVGDAAKNPFLAQAYEVLLVFGMRLAHISFSYGENGKIRAEDKAHHNSVKQEHRAILDAVRLGDAETCEKLGGMHAKLFQQRFLKQMQSNDLVNVSVK